ncbi:MAG TPA: polymer-forming cytoskeletal protein [Gemmatimonadales bacterium]
MAFLKRRPSVPTTAAAPGYSVLDAQLTVVGDLETEGTLRIDGTLRGSIRSADLVILGAEARVEGDVTAREVIVAGAVLGNIEAAERTEVQASAVVTGDINTGAVLIHEGGAVRGRLLVRAHEERARAMRPTPRSMRLVAGGVPALPATAAGTAASGDE